MMVFSVLIIPNFAEAADAIIDKTETGSYIKAEVTGAAGKDYVTITTIGQAGYGNVTRGNVFLTFPAGTDLTDVDVTLTAQKEFGFTLGSVTVNPGESALFPSLNLTQENTATLDVSSDPDFDEGSYVITGGIAGEEVTVITEINVDNPRDWLEGTYEIPDGYTIPDPEDYPDTADIQDAIDGFDSDTLIDIYNVPVGTTAMDVLALFGEKHNMNITGIPQGYISYMGRNGYNQIGEFDINFYSGWMYTVDEGDGWYFPNVGASAKTFNRDTEMIWHFTMAYGADIGAPWGEPDGEPGIPDGLSSLSTEGIVPQWAESGRTAEEVK